MRRKMPITYKRIIGTKVIIPICPICANEFKSIEITNRISRCSKCGEELDWSPEVEREAKLMKKIGV